MPDEQKEQEIFMGRGKRVHYAGCVYHVVNRGNNRQALFLEPADQRHYLGFLYRCKQKYGFKLFAFCLMTNHVHLLLRVGDRSISKIIQSLTVAYSRWYNYKYKCCGHVWQGRFHSSLVSDDEYLLTAMQYIEQNPVRARMVKEPGEYLFSSYRLNVRHQGSKLLDRNENLAFKSLASDDIRCCYEYQRKMTGSLDAERLKNIRKSFAGNGGYLSERFKHQMAALLPSKRKPGRPRKLITT